MIEDAEDRAFPEPPETTSAPADPVGEDATGVMHAPDAGEYTIPAVVQPAAAPQ